MLRGLSLVLSIIRETQISKLTPTHTQWLRMWKLSVGFFDKERNQCQLWDGAQSVEGKDGWHILAEARSEVLTYSS